MVFIKNKVRYSDDVLTMYENEKSKKFELVRNDQVIREFDTEKELDDYVKKNFNVFKIEELNS